ncbi:MAG: cyclic-di-AMP receptor [Chloroflexota bacterium]
MPEPTGYSAVNRLVTAVVQEQDVDVAIRALDELNIRVTRLPSTGGFLGRRSATLLIGFASGQEIALYEALRQACRTRVEYVTIPLEGSTLHLPAPTPVMVGGATLFAFEVERYEEF